MHRLHSCGQALAILLVFAGCDSLGSVPGVRPRSASVPPPPRVAMGPWLLDPAPGQVTVSWLSDAPVVGRVWYGTAAPDKLAIEPGEARTDHRVVLPSLPPATQIRYRVEGSPAGAVFTSAPDSAEATPFQVLVYGDNRSNGGDHALVVRAAAAARAQLALHTGDMVVDARQPELWRIWFDEERDLLAATPFVATLGNHEITDSGVTYSKYFQHRDRPPYWSLDYGPLHIVVLDSFETAAGATPHSGGMSEAQKAWFVEDVRTVPAGRHVWVLVHQGPYSHPAHVRPGHGGSEPVRAAVLAAQKVHPIEAVFAGHEHFFERGEADGLRYFVLGGGGAPLEEPEAGAPGVLAAQKALSYAIVSVCGCHVSGKVEDIAGKVLDTFQLATCAIPCASPGAEPAAP